MFRYKLLPLFLISCFIFSGCSETSSLSDHTSDHSDIVMGTDVNENHFVTHAAVRGGFVAYYSSDNIYFVDSKVSLVNIDNNDLKKVVLCAQTGCTHSDEACNAFLSSGLQECILYHDVWYFTVYDRGSASFKSLDQKTGERKAYLEFKASQDCSYTLSLCGCAGGNAYVYYMENSFDSNKRQVRKDSILKVNLDTGEEKEILSWSSDKFESWSYFGGYENHILLEHSYLSGIIPIEEWEGTQEDYQYYLSSLETRFEFIILDTESLSQSVIAGNDDTDLITPSEPSISFGQYFVLPFGDTVRRYDMTTGKFTEILKHSGIINYFIYDAKVFYLVRSDHLELWCADLDGSNERQLENPDNYMTFGIDRESEDVFFGYTDLGECLIKKQDFYDGRYEQAFPVGN